MLVNLLKLLVYPVVKSLSIVAVELDQAVLQIARKVRSLPVSNLSRIGEFNDHHAGAAAYLFHSVVPVILRGGTLCLCGSCSVFWISTIRLPISEWVQFGNMHSGCFGSCRRYARLSHCILVEGRHYMLCFRIISRTSRRHYD